MHHDPVEVVLDHARDAIVFDGDDLPFALSTVTAKAQYKDGVTEVTLTLSVDTLRVVAPPAPEPTEAPEPPLSPAAAFERRFDQIRGRQRGIAR